MEASLNQSSKVNFYLVIMSSVAALGGFLFGYDTGIISGALVFIRQSFSMSIAMQEVVASAVLVGALLGALLSGQLADKLGSKNMLIYVAMIFIVGTLLSTFAINLPILIVGRIIVGIAIGIISYVSPLFISEIAPAKKRGALVLLNGIMITGGQAISFLICYVLIPTQSWRLMFATGLIPAILLLFGMMLLPHSPRWMALKGRIDQARDILYKIRNANEAVFEFHEIMHHLQIEKNNWLMLFSKLMRPVLIIGVGLGMLQQFVGISTVMYYGPTIFKATGFQNHGAQILATFAMGLVNCIVTIIAFIIVDKLGRRRMLLLGSIIAGISLSLVSMTFYSGQHSILFAWTTFGCFIFYIAGYSLSLGSLFWLVISEIYPLNIRSLAMSFVTTTQWIANFIVVLTFLSILEWVGPVYTFYLYALMCLISFLFCFYFVPETRGVSLEHIEKNLRQGKSARELGQPLYLPG